MWANAQRNGHPAEYRWRCLFSCKVWLTTTTGVPCSNAAKTRNPLKFAGVPQTGKLISAISGPKFAILWGHVEEVLMFNKFFPIVNTCLCCKDIPRQSCAMVPRWWIFGNFLGPAFPASLHSKFALKPHCVEVWQTSSLRWLRLGEEKKKEQTAGQK